MYLFPWLGNLLLGDQIGLFKLLMIPPQHEVCSKHMNLMFGEIRDKLERQDTAIANLQRGQQPIAHNVRGNNGVLSWERKMAMT